MSLPTVVLENVSYQYANSKEFALRDLSLEIHSGEFFGIIGATGAGKSTLCLALNGIVPQFYGGRFFGKLSVMGLDSLDTPISQLSGVVGEVFEDPETQLIATSVENEVAFTLENIGLPREEIIERIKWALGSVRLEGMEKKRPSELSGGQKQCLAIAAALAQRPKILVLDEPTSQLDPIGSKEVFRVISELNKELGITVIVSSQAAEEMAEHTDRVALLDQGKLCLVGTPGEVYGQVDLLGEKGLRPPQVTQCIHSIAKMKGRGNLPVRLDEGMALLPQIFPEYAPVSIERIESDSDTGNAPIISVHNLDFRYPDGTEALQNVSLDIYQHEYILIAGQNGAGKSTLVKHMMGLFKLEQGKIKIFGEDAGKMGISGIAQRIGYVSQNPDHQIFNQTVDEEVGYSLRLFGYSQADINMRTEESLSQMGLCEVSNRHPLSLSRGDRARVVIAAVLAMKPEVIIFDEPTIGQDLRGAQMILESSRKLHQSGMTILLITHHLYLMPEYAHRMVVMGNGAILLDAPLREAYYQFEKLRQSYLEPPQAVLLGQAMSQMARDFPRVLTPVEFSRQFSGRVG